MKLFLVGFVTVLTLAGAAFCAVWKYLDRMEARDDYAR